MQQRPGCVGLARDPVTAGQAWRLARDDERSDGGASGSEGHRKVGDVLAQVRCEPQGGGGSRHEHHGHVCGARPRPLPHALIVERLAEAVVAARVRQVVALDPGAARRVVVLAEERLDTLQHESGSATGRFEGVRDDVEGRSSEGPAQPREQGLDPRGFGVDQDTVVEADLYRPLVPPQQGEGRVQAGERGRRSR
jgi:hypothetical protein